METLPDINPWMVDNVSVFLNYCCPECDFKEKNLQLFSDHALGQKLLLDLTNQCTVLVLIDFFFENPGTTSSPVDIFD